MGRCIAGALTLFLTTLAATASAQSVPFKTVPEPMTETLPLPTSNPGLAGISFARDDSLRDPFESPAMGALGPAFQISVAPQFYMDHRRTLEGHSLPVAMSWNTRGWFGAAALGTKDARDTPNEFRNLPWQIRDAAGGVSGENRYVAGSFGRVLFGRLALGATLIDAEVEIVDGVRRSYPEALSVSQKGTQRTLLLGGLLDAGEGRLLDVAFGQTDVDVIHDVLEWDWVPSPSGVDGFAPVEHWSTYHDRARIDHARIRYRHYVPSLLTQVAAVATVHSREQLESPSFDLVNVPRDPGTSTFYELGLGFQASDGGVADFFAEVAYVPGRARTKTLADTPTNGRDGGLIDTGQALVDHSFRFSNWRVDGGAEFNHGRVTAQLGIGAREHRFTLDQTDHRNGRRHESRESWMEWAIRAGFAVEVGRVTFGYTAQIQARGLSPCPPHSFRTSCYGNTETFPGTGEVVAPTSPETLPDFQVFSHGPTLKVTLGD